MMLDAVAKRRGDEATKGAARRERGRALSRQIAISPSSLRRSVAGRLLRRGYSFPEVMFAVVVLGIGFIMLAAIFPVAVKQTKATMDQTRAMGIGRSAVGTITGLADGSDAPDTDFYKWAFNEDRTVPPKDASGAYRSYGGPQTTNRGLPLQVGNSLFPATGTDAQGWFTKPNKPPGADAYPPDSPGTSAASAFPGRVFPVYTIKGWDALRGNLINVNDTRYAWTFLYRRDGNPRYPPSTWSPMMQVYVIVANVRSRTNFDTTPDGPDIGQFWNNWTDGKEPPQSSFSTANLFPRTAAVNVTNDYQNPTQPSDGPGPDSLTYVPTDDPSTPAMNDGLAEGTYLVMRDSGKVYQLGPKIADGKWELVPGEDLQSSAENSPRNGSQVALFLGRERQYPSTDPNHTGNKVTFTGPAQDIYLYTAVVPIGRN